MNISSIRTDHSKELEGVWVPLDHETSVRVRHTDTLEFRRAREKKVKPYQNGFRTGTTLTERIGEAAVIDINISLLVEEVLVDWKGIFDGYEDDGETPKPVPYSKAAARQLLQVKAFRDMIENAAADISNFRAERAEEDAKN